MIKIDYNSEDSDIMTLDDFLSAISADVLTDDDGYGFYATKTEMDDKRVIVPSHLCNPQKYYEYPPTWASHVVWFNR